MTDLRTRTLCFRQLQKRTRKTNFILCFWHKLPIAKKFDKDNDKEIWDSFLWENANAYTPDDDFEVGFCLYGGKKVDKAVVFYYNADGNTVIDYDVYDCETKETMDNIVEMHKGIANAKIVTLGERLKFVS